MAQIIRITSEALQQTIRRLLPSQQGFGEDLQASNVIQPIIDLTPTAEGSQLPTFIQQALAFGSQTSFAVSNTTTTIINTPGFWRLVGVATCTPTGLGVANTSLLIRDGGIGSKIVWEVELNTNATEPVAVPFDLTFFLRPNDEIVGITNDAANLLHGSVRQVATVTGELVNPSGFNPE